MLDAVRLWLGRAFTGLSRSCRAFTGTAHPGRKGTRLSSSRHDYRSLVGRDSCWARLGTSLVGMAAHPLFRCRGRISCRVIACFGCRRDSRADHLRLQVQSGKKNSRPCADVLLLSMELDI